MSQLLSDTKKVVKKIFVLPIGNQIFKIGSNYQHDYKDALPSLEIKKHLCEKIEKIIPNINYEIVSHKAGIRPATILRKPFIGIHKNIRNAFLMD